MNVKSVNRSVNCNKVCSNQIVRNVVAGKNATGCNVVGRHTTPRNVNRNVKNRPVTNNNVTKSVRNNVTCKSLRQQPECETSVCRKINGSKRVVKCGNVNVNQQRGNPPERRQRRDRKITGNQRTNVVTHRNDEQCAENNVVA